MIYAPTRKSSGLTYLKFLQLAVDLEHFNGKQRILFQQWHKHSPVALGYSPGSQTGANRDYIISHYRTIALVDDGDTLQTDSGFEV